MSTAAPTLVVVGDCLLDEDVLTTAERLSPDGPVPVLDEVGRRQRAGGAALAARLAADVGMRVVLVSPLADDADGRALRRLIDRRIEVVALPDRGATSVKTRLRAGGQTVTRVDRGSSRVDGLVITADGAAAITSAGVVLVADYGRGSTRDPAVRELLTTVARRVPVVWDPHPRGGTPVPGSALVTPNAAEAAAALGAPRASDVASAARQAQELVIRWDARAVAVTIGARGAVLCNDLGALTAHPVTRAVSGDPCGAGDSFAAAASVALARGAVPSEAVSAAVDAAGRYLAAGGVDALDRRDQGGHSAPSDGVEERIARVHAAGGTVVATGGCFDLLHAGHVATLEAARGLGDMLVVCVNSDESVRALKGPARPLQRLEDRVRVLEGLRVVDAVVVFEETTPDAVLARLRPDLWVKGGDYSPATLPETDLVQSWGGQVVCVPYLAGRSTTELVALARR